MAQPEINLGNVELKIDPVQKKPMDKTVQEEAYALHLAHAKNLREKINTEMAQLQERQDKIRFVHEVMQEINNLMDSNGSLNLKNSPELQEKLKYASTLGIKLPPESKLVHNTAECKRILENLHFSVDDWEREDGMQMRKIQTYYSESEQSIMIAKDTFSRLKAAIDAGIRGIKGG
jgi:hypothetical protein